MQEAQHVFVPRETLPDSLSSLSTSSEKASLLGARLYVHTENGVQCPAVKLGERGYHVQGHLVSAGADVGKLLEKADALENFPARSEKDVVKVVTESGKRVNAYVYHMDEVDKQQVVPENVWKAS
ncbi:hypothetical protein KFL_000600260 [Klebsormidium nitens]|uniref:Gamma-glutamylcyclotransferase AIG2-like domain-containing protein n=1 Tax=Klebsormidium nitens TaxID=105231 RepID=A0A1Y1HU60_KLENI|nr:hypothetical protein KFL_000600260 [Klebsormidium nitens]|eukprot:GAQ80709.1 hypothetical protein KFL_000600260 [Klebsormidium nitens]